MLSNRPMSFNLKVLATTMLFLLVVAAIMVTAQAIWLVAIKPDFIGWAILITFASIGIAVASTEIINLLWSPRHSADSE